MNHEILTNELYENTKSLIEKVEKWKMRLMKRIKS